MATIDPPRAIRIKTSTGWADLALAGQAGAKWWTGSGAPSTATGVVNDFYLDSTTGNYYQKTASTTWTLQGNIKGPTGATGANGATGNTGPQGPTGPGVPTGGAVGTILTKTGSADYASAWSPAPVALPPGGGVGQSLTKKTAADGDAQWVTLDNLHYLGDYAAGNFVEGDIVVLNGVAYLCAVPTNTSPAVWPGAPVSQPTPLPAYGTSLPTTPINGQEAILVDSVTNPSYQWRFRYNSSSTSAYKWEFIGGAPAQNEILTSEGVVTSNLYADMPTPGPSVTVPRAGEYDIEFSAEIVKQTATGYAYYTPKLGAAATNDNDAAKIYDLAGNNKRVARKIRRTLAAGDLVKMQYKGSDANQVAAMLRNLHIVPARVS